MWLGPAVLTLLLACVRISEQFKVRLNKVERCEWYSQSISVYIIYPSNGPSVQAEVPCNTNVPCAMSWLSA